MARRSFKLGYAFLIVELAVVIHDGPEHLPDDLLARDKRLGDQLKVLVGF